MLTIDFLGSGSGGNATLVRWGKTCVLVDCGFGPRVLRRRLAEVGVTPESLSALLVTHEHGDHVAGLRALARLPGLPVHLTERTADAVGGTSAWACEPVPISPGRPFRVGPIEVLPFPTAHDARQPVGFVLSLPDRRRLGIATDLGHATRAAIDALRGCHLLAIEANHDPKMLRSGPYPAFLKRRIGSARGHLSNADAADLLDRVAGKELERLFALHVSRTNNAPELARRALQGRLRRLGLSAPVDVVEQDRVLRYPPPGQLELF